MGSMRKFVLFIFSIYASSLGYALSTLLKTCEGENLQDCVRQAESMLSDPHMTFPDDNNTLQSVCRMWDEMTDCTYNYTERCLTRKENAEFHHYFRKPMTSMTAICSNGDLAKEYLLHASCIKKISLGENYCGSQYKILIDQIVSASMSSMKKICCALTEFKDCVMMANANHVCNEGRGDKDIASYALRTLDKSILAFVTHSCEKEGYHQQKCTEEEEPAPMMTDELSPLKEARMDFVTGDSGNGTDSQSPSYTTVNEMEPSFTPKPLLVPISQMAENARRGQTSVLHGNIRANITNLGELGKIPTDMNIEHGSEMPSHQIIPIISTPNQQSGRSIPGYYNPKNPQNNNNMNGNTNNNNNNRTPYPNWLDDLTKITNVNMNNNNSRIVTDNNKDKDSSNPIAEKRIDLVGSPSIDNTKYIVDPPLNSSSTSSASNGASFGNLPSTGNSNTNNNINRVNDTTMDARNNRVNAGRSLNFLDPLAKDLEKEKEKEKERALINNFKKLAPENTTHRPTTPLQQSFNLTNNSTIIKIFINSSSVNPTKSTSSSPLHPSMKNHNNTNTKTNSNTQTHTNTYNSYNINNDINDSMEMTKNMNSHTNTNSSMNNNNNINNKNKSPSPRILNNIPTGTSTNNNRINEEGNLNGDSLSILNQNLGLFPPKTTPTPRKMPGGPGGSSKRVGLVIPSSTKNPVLHESKNSGNYSVSDVPIKVFFVWLSTFFV